MSARDDDILIGEADRIHVAEYDGEEFDYAISGPDRGEFAFRAPEIPDLIETFEHMLGNG